MVCMLHTDSWVLVCLSLLGKNACSVLGVRLSVYPVKQVHSLCLGFAMLPEGCIHVFHQLGNPGHKYSLTPFSLIPLTLPLLGLLLDLTLDFLILFFIQISLFYLLTCLLYFLHIIFLCCILGKCMQFYLPVPQLFLQLCTFGLTCLLSLIAVTLFSIHFSILSYLFSHLEFLNF